MMYSKGFVKVSALFYLLGSFLPSQAQSNCPLTAKVTCDVDGVTCGELLYDPSQCGVVEANFKFELCNTSPDNQMFVTGYQGKIKSVNPLRSAGEIVRLIGFRTGALAPNTCMTYIYTRPFDLCNGSIPWAIIWARSTNLLGEECNPYTRYYEKPLTLSPTQSPTPVPNCDIAVDVSCTVVGDGTSCEDILFDPSDCKNIKVKHKYSVCNKEQTPVKIIFNGKSSLSETEKNLVDLDIPKNLGPLACKEDEVEFNTNTCKKLVWASATSWGEDFKTECYDFKFLRSTFKTMAPTQAPTKDADFQLVDFKCFIDDGSLTSCANYVAENIHQGQGKIDVYYEYVVTNIGERCEFISAATVFIDGRRKNVPIEKKRLCTDMSQTIVVSDRIDIFSYGGTDLISEIEINGGDGQTSVIQIPYPMTGVPTQAPIQGPILQIAEVFRCFIDDGSNTKCVDYVAENVDQGQKKINVYYEYDVTNVGGSCDQIKSGTVTIDGATTNIRLGRLTWQEKKLCPSETITLTAKDSIAIFSFGGQEIISEVRINDGDVLTSSLAIPEPLAETSPPTVAPTGYCGVALAVKCFGEADDKIGSGAYNVACTDLSPDPTKCGRTIQHRYVVKNNDVEKETLQYLATSIYGGPVIDLINDSGPIELNPNQLFVTTKLVNTNFCANGGTELVTTASVTATSASGLTCGRQKAYSFTPESPGSTLQFGEANCFIDDGSGISCADYIRAGPDPEKCNVDVYFEYEITNEGPACEQVKSATVSIDGETLNIPLGYLTWQERRLCKGQTIKLVVEHTINLCFYGGKGLVSVVRINDGGSLTSEIDIPEPDTPRPSSSPTEYCGVALAVHCYAEQDNRIGSGIHVVKCDEMTTDRKICNRTLRYRYIVKNQEEDLTETLKELTTSIEGGVTMNVINSEVLLQPGEVFKKELVVDANFCRDEGKSIETSAYVQAESSLGASCSREKKTVTIYPTLPTCQVEMKTSTCTINDGSGISCQDFIDLNPSQCRADVTFEYTLENTLPKCLLLNYMNNAINDGPGQKIDLTVFTWKERRLCKGEKLKVTENVTMDLCADNKVYFDMKINSGKSEGGCDVYGNGTEIDFSGLS